MAVIEAIETIYLEADVSSVTFSSIPATYEHLQLRISAKNTRTSNHFENCSIRLNGDTGSSYTMHRMAGYSSSTTAAGSTATMIWQPTTVSSQSTQDGSQYSPLNIDILDYANTNKNTTLHYINAFAIGSASGDPYVQFGSALWTSTDAVDEIEIAPYGSYDFVRGSGFTLYGLNSS
jgi:hypothetical protein